MPVNSNYSLDPGEEQNRQELLGWGEGGKAGSECDQAR